MELQTEPDLIGIDIKDLTEAERTQFLDRAIEVLKQAQLKIDQMYWKVGEIAWIIKSNKLYKKQGTWEEFVEALDIGISYGELDHYIRVFRTYPATVKDERRIKFTRLLSGIPYVKENNMEEFLDKAEQCSDRGFKDVILEFQNKEPSDKCLHKKTITICIKCRKRIS